MIVFGCFNVIYMMNNGNLVTQKPRFDTKQQALGKIKQNQTEPS